MKEPPSEKAGLTNAQRRRALFILGFCALYLGVQLFMIVHAHFTPNKHFGFWMFPESTSFEANLVRVLNDGSEIKTRKGSWTVQTDDGPVSYQWNSFVQGYRLDRLGDWGRCKGSFNDTVKYFQAALDYVADRIPEDASTARLVLKVRYRRAGGPQEFIVIESKPRLCDSPTGRPKQLGPVTSLLVYRRFEYPTLIGPESTPSLF